MVVLSKSNDLIERNKAHVVSYHPTKACIADPEVSHILIVSCADPRVNPDQIFQLHPGEAIIIRNIAGHTKPVINEILTLDVAFRIDEIILLHHTGCGSMTWTDESIRHGLKARNPSHDESLDSMVTGAVGTSIDVNLWEDLKVLKTAKLMRPELAANTRGFVYDLDTGRLTEVFV